LLTFFQEIVAVLSGTQGDNSDEDIDCRQIRSTIPDALIDRVKDQTEKDPNMSMLRQVIKDGWPNTKSELPTGLTPFFDIRDTLTTDDGIILKGERILIPQSMRRDIKDKLHSAHLAYDSMMRRARQTVFWPGMSAEIKAMADNCETCQALKPANPRETLIQHNQGTYPWEKIACDLMEIDGRNYLITVDYFSNFTEADYLTNTESQSIIMKLKGHFARFVIPKVVVTDCGPQFVAREFSRFAEKWGFQHVTSSPEHPKSNGRAESAVKNIKYMMKKANRQKQDQYEALLELRNTPRQYEKSPAEMMLARRPRTLIPSKPTTSMNTDRKSNERNDAVTKSYNKHARDLPPLQRPQPVYYRNPNQPGWNKGRIVQTNGQRQYTVEGENGGIYRRNRVHLRPKSSPFRRENDDEFEPMRPTNIPTAETNTSKPSPVSNPNQ